MIVLPVAESVQPELPKRTEKHPYAPKLYVESRIQTLPTCCCRGMCPDSHPPDFPVLYSESASILAAQPPGGPLTNYNDIVFGFGHQSDDILLVVEAIREFEVSRREWMVVLLQATSALAVAMPAAAAANTPSPPSWTPRFLSAEQNDTLVSLGERIVPGSTEALCNRLIDSMLAIESEKNKRALVQALAAFDNQAVQLHRQPFRKLSPAQQDEILNATAPSDSQLHAEFGIVKEWMADAYWSSRDGLRELGSTGRLAWNNFPGCSSDHPHN